MRALGHRISVLVLAAAAVAKVTSSCVDLDSLGNGPLRDASAPEGEPADAAPEAASDPCSHDQLPAATGANDSDAELPTFGLAFDTVALDPAEVTALDLDGVCTCDDRPGSRDDGGPSCRSAMTTCDGDGGTDDALGAVTALTASSVGVEGIANGLIAAGHRTLLVQIAKYNGLANDDAVQVGTMVAAGIHAQGCASSVLDPSTGLYSAGRCGDDPWAIAAGAIVGSVPLVVGTGYVRDYDLVVTQLSSAVTLPFNDETTLDFRLPSLSGHLVPLAEDLTPRDPTVPPTEKEKRLFRLEGTLTGRVLATESLGALGSYVQSNGARLCTSSAFSVIRDSLCGATDIQGRPSTPADPTQPCDALSAALGFTAIPAVTSFVSDAGPPDAGCGGVDASLFACP